MMMDKSDGTCEPIERKITIVMGRSHSHRGTTHRHKRAAHQVEADVSGCVYAHDHARGQEHGLEQQPFHAASRPPIRV